MPALDLDQLFALAEASPALDEAEAALRAQGLTTEADALLKLQEDTGVAIDREMNGYDPAEPAPGPESARLNAAYLPVTAERLDTLRQARQKLPEGTAKTNVTSLMTALNMDIRTFPVPKHGQSPSV